MADDVTCLARQQPDDRRSHFVRMAHAPQRQAILAAAEDFAQAAGIGRKRADAVFCTAYAGGAMEVAPWVREAVKSLTPRTLARWRAVKAVGAFRDPEPDCRSLLGLTILRFIESSLSLRNLR